MSMSSSEAAMMATVGAVAAAGGVTMVSRLLGEGAEGTRSWLLSAVVTAAITAQLSAAGAPFLSSSSSSPLFTILGTAALAPAVLVPIGRLMPAQVAASLLSVASVVAGAAGVGRSITAIGGSAMMTMMAMMGMGSSILLLLLAPQVLLCGFRRPGWQAAAHALDAMLWRIAKPPIAPSPEDFFVPTRGGQVRMRVITPQGAPAVLSPGQHLPPGTQAAVILVPDAPVFVEHAMPAAEVLARGLGLPVAVFDLPGFGLSRPALTYDHRLATGAAVIEDVAAVLGAPRVLLHGSCVTGLYCLAYAQHAGGRKSSRACPCAGVVVGNTPCLSDLKRWTEHNVTIKTLFWPLLGQLLFRFAAPAIVNRWFSFSVPPETPSREERVREWQATAHHCLGKQGGCWCFAGVVQGVYYDSDDAIRAVPSSVPVVNLWGPGDRSHKKVGTNPASLERLVPHARTVVLPADAGHAPGLERPDLLLSAFRDLLPLPSQ